MSLSILWLARIIPLPLNAGDRIYTANLVSALSKEVDTLTFLGLQNPDDTGGSIEELDDGVDWKYIPGAPRSKTISLIGNRPLVSERFATASYRRKLKDILAETRFDAVVLDQYAMVWAIDYVDRRDLNRTVLVHVAHDFETGVTDRIGKNFKGNPLRKIALKRNASKTSKAEIKLAEECDLLVTLTAEDAEDFRRLDVKHEAIVLSPGYSGPRCALRYLAPDLPRKCLIVGSFQWIAKQINLENFLIAALPILGRSQITVEVVGKIPDDVLKKWGQNYPNVQFSGFVEDLQLTINQSRMCLVVDEVGGGFKLKTLDYIFMRSPVAAIRAALNGIPAAVSSNFVVAESFEELARQISNVIDDIPLLQKMQEQAYSAAEDLFDWAENGKRFSSAIQRIRDEKV